MVAEAYPAGHPMQPMRDWPMSWPTVPAGQGMQVSIDIAPLAFE